MNYDIVIATRNRPDVLGLSIPTFLAQSRRPQAMIIVDASDDPKPAKEQVARVTASADGIRVEHHHTQPGLTAQRELALSRVQSPVVMLPDDDSLWFEGAAEAVMRVYERDQDQHIGGVAMHEMRTPPPGSLPDQEQADQRSLSEKLIYRLSPIRAAIENRITPSPMERVGYDLMRARIKPAWLHEVGATPVPFQHGFKMSFRTESIHSSGGFDTTLDAYALYEDFDASYKVAAHQLLVRANGARVYHHRQPGKRANARSTGIMLMLNLAYVTCRHTEVDSPTRRMLHGYAKVRYLQYLPRSRSQFGRGRLEGFKSAMRCLDTIIQTPRDDLPALYRRLVDECMSN